MAKISYSKIESIFSDALRKIMIDRLAELATIVDLIRDPEAKISEQYAKQILEKFRLELKKLKETDLKLYEKLNLSDEEEIKFSKELKEIDQENWFRLKALKERIDELKKEYTGEASNQSELTEEHIKKERVKHINKRYNVRDGWLPLH